MKNIVFAVATACALFIAPAQAALYKVEFTATDFRDHTAHAAPQGPISGSIVFTAESLWAPVTKINDIDLTFGRHNFVTSEVALPSDPVSGFYRFGAVVSGANVIQSGTNDFWLSINHGGFHQFAMSMQGSNSIWDSRTGNATITEQFAEVPEPGSVALLLAGVLGIGMLRRRR